MGLLFKNKSKIHDLIINSKLELVNMHIRKQTLGDNASAINLTLKPGGKQLVVIDVVERDRPFSYAETLEIRTKESKRNNSVAEAKPPKMLPPLDGGGGLVNRWTETTLVSLSSMENINKAM